MVQDDKALLQRLLQHEVEFVISGGVCGIMHGVTLVTTDLDVCCRFTSANLYRIQAAVRDLHPYHRLAANKLPFELTDELCSRLKSLYLQTDLESSTVSETLFCKTPSILGYLTETLGFSTWTPPSLPRKPWGGLAIWKRPNSSGPSKKEHEPPRVVMVTEPLKESHNE